MPKKLSRSIRKYIRQEKARIRRRVLDKVEQDKLIAELYKRFLQNQEDYDNTRNIQVSRTKGD